MANQEEFIGTSWIHFICNPSRADKVRHIPLGCVAEAKTRGFCALGILARLELNDSESELLGVLGRRLITTDPFEGLWKFFEEAWDEEDDGKRLQYLSSRHRDSLIFSTPRVRPISEEWRNLPTLERPDVVANVARSLDTEMRRMLSEFPALGSPRDRVVVETEQAA